jgi:hypothetical protein
LVAAYGFDEGAGSAAMDASGNGNNGSLTGTTWVATGKFGAALSFNGTSSLVTVPDSASLDLTNGMTVEAWVRPTSSSGWHTILLKESTGTFAYALYSHNNSNRPASYITVEATERFINGSVALQLNTWTHVATTYDGSNLRIYINGVLRGTRSGTGAMAVSAAPLRIGGNAISGEYFSGLIDEVRVYNRALTATEIQSDVKTPVDGSAGGTAISINSPTPGATVSGTTQIAATVSGTAAITGVQFKVDGNNLGAEDTTSPYSVSWNTAAVSDGSHTLTAVARESNGNTTASIPVNVTVTNTAPTGQWSSLINLPIVPVHAVLLHTGKVLIFDRPSAGPTARVWDPITNVFTSVPNHTTDLFCAGHSAMADGRILVIGGHGLTGDQGTSDVNIFDPVSLTWTLAARMAYKRWYPTATTLPDGRVLSITGVAITATDYVTVPEVYNPANNSWTQLPAAAANLAMYGQMFVLPNGKLGYTGNWEFPGDARLLDVGSQTWTVLDPRLTDGYAAMYEPGKILKCGSSSDSGLPGISSNACHLLDFNSPNPVWQTTPAMAHARTHHNMTLLPDGNVLITGGSTRKDGYNTSFAVYVPEMWSPVTKTFTPMAPAARPRLYHSESLLLPDGRVLSMGGGRDGDGIDQLNAEIYSPPYLFKGSRPSVGATPDVITYGSSFSIATADGGTISSVVLMRPGSPTHGFDFDQRIVKLTFTQTAGGLTAVAPANGNLAPPGYYMLFLVNANAVPSVAKFLRIPALSSSTPPLAPTSVTATGGVGTVAISWQVSSSTAGVSNYNVHRSTTLGFTPAAANRIAQPVATSYVDSGLAAGRYYYRVTAEDTNHSISPPSAEVFGNVAADTQPPQVTLTSPTNPNVSGTTILSANATDDVGIAGVQFLLDGANLLSEITSPPYALSWNSGSAINGSHTISVRARDTGGNATTSSAFNIVVSNTQVTGLAAAYSFSEGSGSITADKSANGNTGNISGATWSTAGKFGRALSFNGTSARVTVADSASLDLTTGFTLMAWVQPSAAGAWRTIVMKEAAGNLAYSLYANTDTNTPGAWFETSSGTRFMTGNSVLPLGVWSHVAATYNGSVLRIYVNGTQAGSKNVTGSINVTLQALQIGGNSVWGEYFAGLIDEVRIYHRALTAAEIQSDMNTPIAP